MKVEYSFTQNRSFFKGIGYVTPYMVAHGAGFASSACPILV